MEYRDLRDFLNKVGELGKLKVINGADWNLEIGSITVLSQEEDKDTPAIIFDNTKGYPEGYRILVNALGSSQRSALALGLPFGLTPLEYVTLWKERLGTFKPVPPILVKKGPLLENVQEGKEVDVLQFPVPLWNELDGGRYIGTGSVDITRDPEEGWVNLGTYRVMVHDEKTLGFYISPGKHGRIHREKWFAKGLPCKVAVSIGHEPLVFIAGNTALDYGFCEYDWVGWAKGEPVEVIEGPFTGLPLPASAELVIEGESLPGETKTEGPFGEWTGYYGSGFRPEPLIHIKRIMYRNNPIIFGEPPGGHRRKKLDDYKGFISSATVWNQIEKAGVSDVKGVYSLLSSGSMIRVISIKQRYPGHAKQAGLAAIACRAAAYFGRYTIVVDDDIDPTDYNQVIWALATRSDPARSIDILRRTWSTALDPIIPKNEKGHNSRAVIEACKPYEWINDFPKTVEVSNKWRENYNKKWRNIIF